MEDNEQVGFSDLTTQLGEESVESSLVDALPEDYERIESINKPADKILLQSHFCSVIPQLNQNATIPQEEWVELEQRFEEKLQKHPHGLDENEVVSEKADIWQFLTGKQAMLTVTDEDGHAHRPTLIDTEDITNNKFAVARQYQYQHPSGNAVRPDIVLFVNGIPVYIVEVKSSGTSGDAKDAVADVRNQYESEAPGLFMTAIAGVGVAENSVQLDDEEYISPLYYRGYDAPKRFESPWYDDANDKEYQSGFEAFADFCKPEQVIQMLSYGQLYTDDGEHIVARHQQYFVARRIVEDVIQKVRACGQKEGAKRFRELISHVQGSGKTYAMLFAARWVHSEVLSDDVRMLVVVDRKNLDESVQTELQSISGWGFTYSKAETTRDLKRLISETDTQLILTTIQKIGKLEDYILDDGSVKDGVTASVQSLTDDVFVSFEDEVHREMLNKQGAVFKAAFPKLIRYGFTGTPTDDIVAEMGGDAPNIFLHEYSLQQALREGVTVDVNTKNLSERLDAPSKALDEEFERIITEEGYTLSDAKEMVQRAGYSKYEEHWESYREKVASHIAGDFQNMYFNTDWNAMVVCGSKKLAAQYASLLQDQFGGQVVQPVYSRDNSDDRIVQEMLELDKSSAIQKFKDEDNSLQLLVVCEMLLTGFDAPSLKCMYLNRDISKEHTLLQALARVNRPDEGKNFGRIIDYKGATQDLQVRLEGNEFTTLTEDEEDLSAEYVDALDDCQDAFGVESWNEFKQNLYKKGHEYIRQVLLKDKASVNEFNSAFKRAKSIRGRLYPATTALKYEPIFDVLALIYRKTGDERVISNLAEAVGRAGGKSLETEAEIVQFEEESEFDISAETLSGFDRDVRLRERVARVKSRVNDMEREFSDVRFSDRVDDLFSRWEDGELSSRDIEALEDDLDSFEENTISVTAQKIKNAVNETRADQNKLTDEDAEWIMEVLQEKSLHLSEENTNKIVGNLASNNSFILDDFGLVKKCTEIVKNESK